ncbi:MAG: peptidase S41 [Bacteroidetes bacterium HGW-Bacteroidetes-21]|nr:MAG: peptidase S41 [Bacteroidetes bacterium HGW-Bacteroidetes-21]
MKRLVILILISVCLGTFRLSAQMPSQAALKYSRVIDLVNTFYVDTVNVDKLTEHAIVEMLKELDPHSVYISKEEVKEMNEPLEGSFDGIGVQFNIMEDTILIVNPIPGGPSEKLGIKAGDRIIKIDEDLVAGVGVKNNDVFKRLRGNKGTVVNVSIFRRGEPELLVFAITRDKIPIYSMDAAYMVDKETGYIKLNRFAATTMNEFREASLKLQKQGAKNLILDLCGNGGGYLNASVDLADEFLEEKKIIVFTKGINQPRTDYKATAAGYWGTGRLILLVDEASASASEIVSGAIQDWDRGLIIGRRTFGKGLVQKPYNLPDGSMMRLTVAKYFTPSGRLIQKPYEDGYSDYSKDIINRYNNGELMNEDSIHFPDSLKTATLVSKRVVYGGGGIMPDFFVPLDTTAYTDLYRDIQRKGLLYKYVIGYLDKNRNELEAKYTDFKTFNTTFEVPGYMTDSIISMAEKEKITIKEEEKPKTRTELSLMIKALLARDLWNTSEYFEVINTTRPEYLKAVEVIADKKKYTDKLK